jgi:hypothetical protein
MWYFFRQAQDSMIDKSPIILETNFRDQNASGLLEKHSTDAHEQVLVFANGEPAGAYEMETNLCKPISFNDFAAVHNGSEVEVRAVKLPDMAVRLTWLSLESQVKDVFDVQSDDAWKTHLKSWEEEKWSGLVEVQSESYHGFALYWEGNAQKNDVFFSTSQGFTTDFPFDQYPHNLPRKIITFTLVPTSQAYQCALLRQGATHWSHKILNRYQELVGQKLLQSMNRELNRLIQPWHWEITLENDALIDAHFFPHTHTAAHAYRALFMGMGTQMSFVIGNNLTQRLLNEAFTQIPANQCAALQAQRLIPAAFSE